MSDEPADGTKAGGLETANRARIHRFTGPYSFLSNFYIVPVSFMGVTYPSLEHAYQASKTLNVEERRMVYAAASPGAARQVGRVVTPRPDWKKIRDQMMFQLLTQKFASHTSCLARLLGLTSDADLKEGNTWHDNYWGDCYCPRCTAIPGENKLGCMLMEIRDLRRQEL